MLLELATIESGFGLTDFSRTIREECEFARVSRVTSTRVARVNLGLIRRKYTRDTRVRRSVACLRDTQPTEVP